MTRSYLISRMVSGIGKYNQFLKTEAIKYEIYLKAKVAVLVSKNSQLGPAKSHLSK